MDGITTLARDEMHLIETDLNNCLRRIFGLRENMAELSPKLQTQIYNLRDVLTLARQFAVTARAYAEDGE